MSPDSSDITILNALRWDAKVSLQRLAKKLHMPLSTLHHRIKRFEETKLIRRYETTIDYVQLGRPIQAFILIEAMNNLPNGEKVYQQDMLEDLKKINAVEEAFIITGTADLLARIRIRDLEELNHLITVQLRKMKGVGATQTMMVLKESDHQPLV